MKISIKITATSLILSLLALGAQANDKSEDEIIYRGLARENADKARTVLPSEAVDHDC